MPSPVRGAEVDRAPWRAPRGRRRAVSADQGPPGPGVALVQQALHGTVRLGRIGDVALGVGEGQLHRLQLQVVALGRLRGGCPRLEPFQDVQGPQAAIPCPLGGISHTS